MSMREDWDAIAARIRGVASAANHYRQSRMIQDHDNFAAEAGLRAQCASILEIIEEFRAAYRTSLRPEIIHCIDRLAGSSAANYAKPRNDHFTEGTAMFVVPFELFEGEVTYLLADNQQHLRLRTERALMLLQRQLTVDEEIRGKWKRAVEREVPCERLGAVHLLSQGIYGFKAVAPGAATDLILPELPDEREIMRAAEGLVLTEWKWLTEADALQLFAVAREQAHLYGRGILAGAELRSYRYLIGVSLAELPLDCVPKDLVIDDVTYRHINVVIDPDVPSKAAKRSARKALRGGSGG